MKKRRTFVKIFIHSFTLKIIYYVKQVIKSSSSSNNSNAT